MNFSDTDFMTAIATRLQSEAVAVTQTEIELLTALIKISFRPNFDAVSEAEISLLESILPLIAEEMLRLETEL